MDETSMKPDHSAYRITPVLITPGNARQLHFRCICCTRPFEAPAFLSYRFTEFKWNFVTVIATGIESSVEEKVDNIVTKLPSDFGEEEFEIPAFIRRRGTK